MFQKRQRLSRKILLFYHKHDKIKSKTGFSRIQLENIDVNEKNCTVEIFTPQINTLCKYVAFGLEVAQHDEIFTPPINALCKLAQHGEIKSKTS